MFHLQMVYILIVHSHFSFFVASGYLSCTTHNHFLTLKTVVCHFLCSSLGFSIRFNFFKHNTYFLYQKGMEAWPFLWSWVPFVHSNYIAMAFKKHSSGLILVAIGLMHVYALHTMALYDYSKIIFISIRKIKLYI